MASETKEIAKAIDKLTAEMRKGLARIENAIYQKQFDDWVSPPIGTVYQNNRGCVMMSKFDFEKLVRNSDEEGEEK